MSACPAIAHITVLNPAPAVLGITVTNPLPAVCHITVAPALGALPLQFGAVAAEVLSSNCLVHVQLDGQLVRADASLGLPAHGLVRSASVIGAVCQVITGGICNGFAGRTPGKTQYLGNAGQMTETAPSGAGQLVQAVGTGVTASRITLDFEPVIELA